MEIGKVKLPEPTTSKLGDTDLVYNTAARVSGSTLDVER